jgi:hypothetical protein
VGSHPSHNEPHHRVPSELELAAKRRLEADRQLSMSDRLAALNELCRQVAAIGGAAKRR